MEPTNAPELRKLLREWKVEDAPRSLDDRVLGVRRPWWSWMLRASVRVPVPVVMGLAVLFAAMTAALLRPRPIPVAPAVSSAINLTDFQPVEDVQVRIMRGSHVAQ
jgi:hypothetical protein